MKSLQPQAGGLPLRLAATRCLRAPQRPAPPHLTAPVVARVLRSARQLPGAPWGRSGVARRATAAPARLPLRVAAAAARSPVEVLLDGVPGKGELLSPRLDPEVRQRAERAIAARGGRVTIGDVASSAGLRLDQAEEAVRALAADCAATLQVTDDGDIVWLFPRGFQDTIRSKSLLLRLEPTAKAVKAGAEYAARVAFGTALMVSVAVVAVALTAIATSGSDNNRDRRSSGGYGGGPRMFFNMTDLLWYWDPYYAQRRRQRMQQQQGMNFLEAIFSWVFGDGDPNAEFDRKRWEAVGRYIQSRGGTVAAEELAPFLDLQPGQLASDRGRITVNESYMLPVLARFNGSPAVDAAGNIVYSFPDLQTTAAATSRSAPPRSAALEQRWQLTAAAAGQKLGAIALGAFNFVGVATLTFLLADPMNRLALAQNGLLWVAGAMPYLQVYAAAFFAVPLFRWVQNAARNREIDARNAARQEAVRLLAAPDATLQAKMAGAAAAGRQRVITDRDVVYRSDRPLEEQPADLEGDSFEARMVARERQRQGKAAAAARQPQQQQGVEPPLWWQQQQERQQQKERQQHDRW